MGRRAGRKGASSGGVNRNRERGGACKQPRAPPVFQRHLSPRPPPTRTGGGRGLARGLGGQLLAGGLAARGLAGRLLRASHCWWRGEGGWVGREENGGVRGREGRERRDRTERGDEGGERVGVWSVSPPRADGPGWRRLSWEVVPGQTPLTVKQPHRLTCRRQSQAAPATHRPVSALSSLSPLPPLSPLSSHLHSFPTLPPLPTPSSHHVWSW